MRHSLPRIGWYKTDGWHAVLTLLLGIVLCTAPVVFLQTRLREAYWQPIVHGLSEDGTTFLSINLNGIRLHDAATGTEVDRTSFVGQLPQFETYYGSTGNVLHSMELAAPENGDWDRSTIDDDYGGLGYGRARIKISPSKRYVLALFPSGYFLFWDRKTGNMRVQSEPKYLFEAVTIDEPNDRLLVEAVLRGRTPLLVREDTPTDRADAALAPQYSLSVLFYRLSDLKRLEVVEAEDAGKRIGDDPNLRLHYDEDAEEYRVKRCDEFPFGSERVILRFRPRETYQDPMFFVRRINADLAVVVDYFKAPVEMISSGDPTAAKTKWELPKQASDRMWLECGAVSLGEESHSGQFVTTWDDERSFAVFEVPAYDTYSEAAMIRSAQGERRVRLAGREGCVIDLPLGQHGEIFARSMHFSATSDWPLASVCWTLAAGAIWIATTLAWRRFQSKAGWLVLGQWLISCGSMVVLDGLTAGAPFAMLGYAPLLILEAGIIALAAIQALRGYALRSIVLCFVAITTIIILGEAASLQLPTQSQLTSGGCCMFMCFGAPGGSP